MDTSGPALLPAGEGGLQDSLGATVWREAIGDHFVQLSAGVGDTIACNTCGAA